MLAYADEHSDVIPRKIIMFLDEIGTISPIQSVEMMFSASRSKNISIVAIIQSLAQLEKNYGKEGSEIIQDNCQDTIFGGFAPGSQTAEVLSKNLGTRTVQSGSVSQGKNDPSQSLQTIPADGRTASDDTRRVEVHSQRPLRRDENWLPPNADPTSSLPGMGYYLRKRGIHCAFAGKRTGSLRWAKGVGGKYPMPFNET